MSLRGRFIRERNRIDSAFDARQPLLQKFTAVMGDGEGNMYPDADNLEYVFIRRTGRGRVERVRNTRVKAVHNLPVIVGYAPERPDVMQVLDIDDVALGNSLGGYSYVRNHHQQHELLNPLGGSDAVWVHPQQYMYMLCQVTDPPSAFLNVRGGLFAHEDSVSMFAGETTVDLTTYTPAAGLAVMVLISVNSFTGRLVYNTSLEFDIALPEDLRWSLVPNPTYGSAPVAAIYIPNGATVFDWDYVIDWRIFINTMIATGPHTIFSSMHTDSDPNAGDLVRGDLLVANDATVEPLLVRLPVGTSGQIFIMDGAGEDPIWDSFDWDDVKGAAGSDMIHDHILNVDGGNITGSAFGVQAANVFLASPDGGGGVPSFRAIVSDDLPAGVVDAQRYAFFAGVS